jgi:alpha-D-ribose 1-methylphosphonate 5-phosphate C-P lyase
MANSFFMLLPNYEYEAAPDLALVGDGRERRIFALSAPVPCFVERTGISIESFTSPDFEYQPFGDVVTQVTFGDALRGAYRDGSPIEFAEV